MSDGFFTGFLLGLLFSVVFWGLFLGTPERSCERAYNVYDCRMEFVPVYKGDNE